MVENQIPPATSSPIVFVVRRRANPTIDAVVTPPSTPPLWPEYTLSGQSATAPGSAVSRISAGRARRLEALGLRGPGGSGRPPKFTEQWAEKFVLEERNHAQPDDFVERWNYQRPEWLDAQKCDDCGEDLWTLESDEISPDRIRQVAECPRCGAVVTLWCDPPVATVESIKIIAGACVHVDEFNKQLVDGDFRLLDRMFKPLK